MREREEDKKERERVAREPREREIERE